jgi:hypothetical protein
MISCLVVLIRFQAWNTQNSMEISLDGPVGQVYALVVINDMLFAGTQVIFFSS